MSIIMKNLLLFLVFLFWGLLSYAQCSQPYKAFSTFSNDTTSFLRYNFKTRADCYKGKTVAYVLNDLKLAPKSLVMFSSVYANKYEGICIYVDNTVSAERISNSKLKRQCIYIYWDKLLDFSEALIIKRNYSSDKWVQRHYDFFKNNIVGEVAYYE